MVFKVSFVININLFTRLCEVSRRKRLWAHLRAMSNRYIRIETCCRFSGRLLLWWCLPVAFHFSINFYFFLSFFLFPRYAVEHHKNHAQMIYYDIQRKILFDCVLAAWAMMMEEARCLYACHVCFHVSFCSLFFCGNERCKSFLTHTRTFHPTRASAHFTV